jgi:hypothetical protein
VRPAVRHFKGQTFTGWDSTACTGKGACTFKLTSDTVVRAAFSPPPNYVFTTSTTQTPDFGGRSGADSICAKLAANAALPGTYKAWLSTSTENAIDRLGTASGWVRTDGKPVVNSVDDIAPTSGLFDVPPNVTADGSAYYATAGVWGGAPNMTTPGKDATNCTDWKSNSASASGIVGISGDSAAGSFFDTWPDTSCDSTFTYLTCLQE